MIKKLLAVLASGFLFFTSCTTYYIPVDSFKKQFSGIDSASLKSVEVQGPIGEIYRYNANPITVIKCTDKEGKPAELYNSPSIEIRFTYGYKKKRTVFYFDRTMISHGSVIGTQSRFISSIHKSIPLDSISKIEVQDGHKRFTYR